MRATSGVEREPSGDPRLEYEPVPGVGPIEQYRVRLQREPFDLDAEARALGISAFRECSIAAVETTTRTRISSGEASKWLARLSGLSLEQREVSVQPVSRMDYLATNYAAQVGVKIRQAGCEISVAELASNQPNGFKPFDQSVFANNIGVACLLRIGDGRLVWGKRRGKAEFDADRVSCPISGALELRDISAGCDFGTAIKAGVLREASEEMGLKLEPTDIAYLGFARERQRFGKPQVFCLINMPKLSFEQLESYWRSSADGQTEYQCIGHCAKVSELARPTSEFKMACLLAEQVQGFE